MIEIPLELIKSQEIYIVSSCVDVTQNLKPVAIIVNASIVTRELRNTINIALLRYHEVDLSIPIDGYIHVTVTHMTIDKHTGRYMVWGSEYNK